LSGPLPPIADTYAGKRILLTGATGFLGKVYLSALLHACPDVGQVVVLIRADGPQAAHDRFLRDVIASPAFDPLRERHGLELRHWVLSRVRVVRGSLGRDGAGLDEETLAEVTRELDLVVHCAGLVEFVPPLDKALSVNVDGTLAALDLARRAGPGRAAFLHVSTAFVCGLRPGQQPEELEVRDFPARADTAFEGFDPEQELDTVRRLVERIKSEESDDPLVQADLWEEAGGSKRKLRRLTDMRIRRRLVEAGLDRARRWGWPNTYTYSKALAERLVAVREKDIGPGVVVRPAVVESAIRYPFPGWNQGINTSAPLVWMTSQGQRYWPTRPDLFLDIIPVDYVAHGMILAGGAALRGEAEPVYQLGTSDVNPFAMRRVIELASLTYRESPEQVGFMKRFMRRHLEGVDVSPDAYRRLGIPPKKKLARRLQGWLERIPDPTDRPKLSSLLSSVRQSVKTAGRDLERAEQVLDIYLPFIATCPVTFRTDNVRRLFDRLSPEDQAAVPYLTGELDWRHYWAKVHIPGLERWAFPQLRLQVGSGPTEHEPVFESLTALFEDRAKYGSLALWRRLGPDGRVASSVTFDGAVTRAQAGARRLIATGVRPRDRVMLISENSPEWGIGYFATSFAGATSVPLEEETARDRVVSLLRASGARVVLLSERARASHPDLAERAAAEGLEVDVRSLEETVAAPAKGEDLPELPQEQELAPRAPASLIYTSGTTGSPKGVLLGHKAFSEQVRALASLFPIGSGDRILSVLPLHHCFEFSAGFLLPLYGGATVTYLHETTPEGVEKALEVAKPTAMIGVPALFEAWHRKVRRQVRARGPRATRAYETLLAFHRGFRARTGLNLGERLFPEVHEAFGGSLRWVVSGGAALPREVALEFEGLGLDIYEGYGMTEAAPVICAQRPDEPKVAGSVGPAIPGVEVRIGEPDGEGVGEIQARSPSLFRGYDGLPEETARTLVDGWLHTGDLGRIDDDGHLHVVGRLKDAIVDASGNTVHPDEIEDLYTGCGDVSEMGVAGVAVKGEHESVGALIVVKTDGEGGAEGARERVREFVEQRSESLPYPKRIKVLQFTSRALPRTATRKVKRAEVARILGEVARAGDRATGRRGRPAGAGLSRVAAIFEEVAGIDGARVTSDARLSHDLGLDSIALAEVALALAREYDRPAPRTLDGVTTVGELLGLFDQRAGGRVDAQPIAADPRPIVLPEPVREGVSGLLDGLQRLSYERLLECAVAGRGNVPHHTNAIVVANHTSHLDVGLVKHALGEYGQDIVSAGARDYFFKDPLRATYFDNFTNVMAFDRMASVRESLERFVELLRQGKTVLIFPEGTRSVTGRMGGFKPGLGLVVQAARTGVLPIYLSGTYQAMPKGTWIPRRDQPLEARIGGFLPPEQLLGLTSHLGRRQQATAIVEAVRGSLCALRDRRPFDLEAELGALPPEGRRRRSGRRRRPETPDDGAGAPPPSSEEPLPPAATPAPAPAEGDDRDRQPSATRRT